MAVSSARGLPSTLLSRWVVWASADSWSCCTQDIRVLLLHMRRHNVHSALKTSSAAAAAAPDDTATTQEGTVASDGNEGSSTPAKTGPPHEELLAALLNRRQTSVGTFARVCRMMWCCSPDQRVTPGLLDAAVESGVDPSGNDTEDGSSQEQVESEAESAAAPASPALPTTGRRILKGRRRLNGNERA